MDKKLITEICNTNRLFKVHKVVKKGPDLCVCDVMFNYFASLLQRPNFTDILPTLWKLLWLPIHLSDVTSCRLALLLINFTNYCRKIFQKIEYFSIPLDFHKIFWQLLISLCHVFICTCFCISLEMIVFYTVYLLNARENKNRILLSKKMIVFFVIIVIDVALSNWTHMRRLDICQSSTVA